MIAIVDGGSTKCDWVILDHSGKISQKTETGAEAVETAIKLARKWKDG